MSTDLYWKPIKEGHDLDRELKYVLQKRWAFPRILDTADLKYLQGLADAGIADAETLIKAIEKYGHIELEIK